MFVSLYVVPKPACKYVMVVPWHVLYICLCVCVVYLHLCLCVCWIISCRILFGVWNKARALLWKLQNTVFCFPLNYYIKMLPGWLSCLCAMAKKNEGNGSGKLQKSLRCLHAVKHCTCGASRHKNNVRSPKTHLLKFNNRILHNIKNSPTLFCFLFFFPLHLFLCLLYRPPHPLLPFTLSSSSTNPEFKIIHFKRNLRHPDCGNKSM